MFKVMGIHNTLLPLEKGLIREGEKGTLREITLMRVIAVIREGGLIWT